MKRLLSDREVWPHLIQDSFQALRSSSPPGATPPELLATDIADILKLSADQRTLIVLEDLSGEYIFADNKRLIEVTMEVAFAERSQPGSFLNSTVGDWLRANADRPSVPYRIISDSKSPLIDVQSGTFGGPGDDAKGQTARGDDPAAPPPGVPSGARGDDASGSSATSSRRSTGYGRRTPGTGAGSIQRPGGGGSVGFGTGTFADPGTRGGSAVEEESPGGVRRAPSTEDLERAKQLDSLAPIPGLPGFFSNVRFHRGTVRFTVELRDASAPAAAQAAAPAEGQQ